MPAGHVLRIADLIYRSKQSKGPGKRGWRTGKQKGESGEKAVNHNLRVLHDVPSIIKAMFWHCIPCKIKWIP